MFIQWCKVMFEKISNSHTDTAWAIINSDRTISFNRKAQKQIGLSNYKRASLFYDRVEKKIGIKLRNEKTNGDYIISKTNKTNGKICIQKMVREECIRHRGRFGLTAKDGLVIINLKEKIKS